MDGLQFVSIFCPTCNRKLFDVAGLGAVIRVKCLRCSAIVEWPTLLPSVVPASAALPAVHGRHTAPT